MNLQLHSDPAWPAVPRQPGGSVCVRLQQPASAQDVNGGRPVAADNWLPFTLNSDHVVRHDARASVRRPHGWHQFRPGGRIFRRAKAVDEIGPSPRKLEEWSHLTGDAGRTTVSHPARAQDERVGCLSLRPEADREHSSDRWHDRPVPCRKSGKVGVFSSTCCTVTRFSLRRIQGGFSAPFRGRRSGLQHWRLSQCWGSLLPSFNRVR